MMVEENSDPQSLAPLEQYSPAKWINTKKQQNPVAALFMQSKGHVHILGDATCLKILWSRLVSWKDCFRRPTSNHALLWGRSVHFSAYFSF